jgi:hypothetical protein
MAKVREPIDFERDVLEAARAEASRRGVAVSEVVEDAVRRYVASAALVDLLERFSVEDSGKPGPLTDDEAYTVAAEEVDTYRSSRRAG